VLTALQIDHLILRINQETCEWSVSAVENNATQQADAKNILFEFKEGNIQEETEKVRD
jgi:hypothetical protein